MLIPDGSGLWTKLQPFSLVKEVAETSFHHCRQSNLPQKTMQMNRILLRKLFKALHGTKISFTLVNCIINNESNWGADLQKSGHVMWFSNKYQLLNRFIERKKTNNLNLYIQRICYYFRLYI